LKISIEKIEAFKTRDGLLFETENEAKLHDWHELFKIWYENRPLFAAAKFEVSYVVARNWIIDNIDSIQQCVNDYKNIVEDGKLKRGD